MKTAVSQNFHVPLPLPIYSRLKDESRRLHTPATQLVRQAIEVWLEQSKRQVLHDELALYAQSNAGTTADLDEALADVSADYLATHESKL
ncbi:MAG: hypothetical protein H7Y05_14020 [Steroidobacteraceae bacterium]|nr:hypothetical protein [Deltaproteobacteria bacterium]